MKLLDKMLAVVAVCCIGTLANVNAQTRDTRRGLLLYFPFHGKTDYVSHEKGKPFYIAARGEQFIQDRFGKPNEACYFLEPTDDMYVADHQDLHLTDFTFLSWVRTERVGGYEFDIVTKPSESNRYSLSIKDSVATLELGNSVIRGSTNVTDKEWHFLAARRDGNSLDLMVDGKTEDRGTANSHVAGEGPASLLIGSCYSGLYHFTTRRAIDDLMIYDRALSNEEILSLMTSSSLAEMEEDGVALQLYLTVNDYLMLGHIGDIYIVSPELKRSFYSGKRQTLTNEEMRFQLIVQKGLKRDGYWIYDEEGPSDRIDLSKAEQDRDTEILNGRFLSKMGRKVSVFCDPSKSTTIDASLPKKDYSRQLAALAIIRARTALKWNLSVGKMKSDYRCILDDIDYEVNALVHNSTGYITDEDLRHISEREKSRIMGSQFITDELYFWKEPTVHFLSNIAWEESDTKESDYIVGIHLAGSLARGLTVDFVKAVQVNQLANEVLLELGEITPIPYSKPPKVNLLGFKDRR